MPYVYHAFTSTVTDSPNSQLVRPSNWNARLQYGNAANNGPSGTDLFVRETLLANRTYYVRTDGSDSNTGLVNSAGGAWLTLQHAMNVIAGTLDFNAWTITVQVGNGTYTGSMIGRRCVGQSDAQGLVFQGDTTTPSNVVISTTSLDCFAAWTNGVAFVVKGFKLQTTTVGNGLSASQGGTIQYQQCDFGACASGHMSAYNGGFIQNIGSYTISGSAPVHWAATGSGSNIICFSTCTVTLTGTPAFSTAFVAFDTVASGNFAGYGPLTFSGAATGVRYSATLNAVIQTYGAGATYFPGDVAGSTATGGQYA